MLTTDMGVPLSGWLVDVRRRSRMEPASERRHRHPGSSRRVGKGRGIVAADCTYAPEPMHRLTPMRGGRTRASSADAIRAGGLGARASRSSRRALRDDTRAVARAARPARTARRHADLHRASSANELAGPAPGGSGAAGRSAMLVRDHARYARGARLRAAGDRDRVPAPAARALALRRRRSADARRRADVLVAEERLNDAVDRLVTECVVAYFDRATSELATGAPRPAHRAAQPPGVHAASSSWSSSAPRRYEHGLDARRSSTSTASRRSTTRSATSRATACCARVARAARESPRLRPRGPHGRRRVRGAADREPTAEAAGQLPRPPPRTASTSSSPAGELPARLLAVLRPALAALPGRRRNARTLTLFDGRRRASSTAAQGAARRVSRARGPAAAATPPPRARP